ncbi:hypothetical protein SAMN02745132_04461 [Enterovibrio nigricans DSM 22720]|uniref:Uncharacterized protein n=1 Tax=Enterovibrio nigricans DSM 22720 TaxID=1121868 RepID=A0A1T4VX48_9GAMM|nr:hypothetical protein SAMN02745132_04461 [Enterovibrio nigricans DSM 22720]
MLTFSNTPCPNCKETGGFLRMRRNIMERSITKRHYQKVKCPQCEAVAFIGAKIKV